MRVPIPPKDEASPEALATVRYKFVLDTDRVILARGRLDRDSGFLTLVQAMPRILERFPDAQLVVVGCGPSLPDILSETHKLGVREQTVFPGEVSDDDLAGLYNCCAVVVAPATHNDHDSAMAQTYGKPTVTIEPDHSGGGRNPAGQPAPLADALIAILADPVLA